VATATRPGVYTTPIWSAIIATVQGVRLAPVIWIGIGVAVAGAVLATGSDLAVSGTAFVGDLLALAGGVAAAAYTAFGAAGPHRAQHHGLHDDLLLGLRGRAAGHVCLVSGTPLAGFPPAPGSRSRRSPCSPSSSGTT
jgi:drug/metabolite transporter (DMT)-like permease